MTIEQRMDQLEKRVNRYRMAMVAMGVAICAMVVMGATEGPEDIRVGDIYAKNIEAKRLYIRNADNELLAIIGSLGGSGHLTLRSEESRYELFYAGADIKGNGLMKVRAKAGGELIVAGATENGAMMRLFNKTSGEIVQLYADDYGNGVVEVRNLMNFTIRTLESR